MWPKLRNPPGFEAQTWKPSSARVLWPKLGNHQRPGFEAQTWKPSTRWFFCGSTTKPSRRGDAPPVHPVHRHVSPGPRPKQHRARKSSLVAVPGCQPPQLILRPPVPQSKPHVRPSPLSVHRHGTSLLDLHLAFDHCIRARHLHNTSQRTCALSQLTITHHSRLGIHPCIRNLPLDECIVNYQHKS